VISRVRPFLLGVGVLWVASMGGQRLMAQQAPPEDGSITKDAPVAEKPDPLKRRLSDKQRFQQQKELKDELKGVYKKWLNEDVLWIITDQETQAFKHLSNDEERDAFIENFWLRRNPNPESPENEFKEQHYQRIAYANEHFAAGKPGWKTDSWPYLDLFRQAGFDRLASQRRQLSAADGRGWWIDLDVPIRGVALPVSGRHRRQHRYRVCR